MVTFFGTEITYQIQTKISLCFSLPILISLTTLGSQFTWIAPTKGPEEYYCVTSGGSRNFFYGVIKKLKLNKNLIKNKKELEYIELLKNTHTHTHKYMKFYNFILRVFIFWNHLMIVYYMFSLSIVNVSMTILFC